jgi:hypothetical protein
MADTYQIGNTYEFALATAGFDGVAADPSAATAQWYEPDGPKVGSEVNILTGGTHIGTGSYTYRMPVPNTSWRQLELRTIATVGGTQSEETNTYQVRRADATV